MRRPLVIAVALSVSLAFAGAAEALVAGGRSVGSAPVNRPLQVHLVLIPQSLGAALRDGLLVRVDSNQPAAGIATVSISRALAKRARIRAGRHPLVVVGIGTVSRIAHGTTNLRLRLARTVAAQLARLPHATLTVRLALVGAAGGRDQVDVAGRY